MQGEIKNCYKEALEELCEKIKELKPHSENYNILTVLGVDYKEVRICRLIGDLLDPNGAHGLGTKPLKLFLDMIEKKFGIRYVDKEDELLNAYVVLEDQTDNKRRVDIAIYIGNVVIPIEAKIWAGDQDKQLCDYYNYYSNSGKEIDKIYYLTPLGKEPSENSCGGLEKYQYENISFNKTIENWLSGILKKGVDDVRVKSLIEQFIEVIYNMCKDAEVIDSVAEMVDFNAEDNLKKIEALKLLFENADGVLRMIKQKYVIQHIECDGYEFKSDYQKPKSYTKDVIFQIVKFNSESKIWICKDDSFYILVEPAIKTKIEGWKNEEDCSWKRVLHRGKAVKMNFGELKYNEKIDIKEILDKIP